MIPGKHSHLLIILVFLIRSIDMHMPAVISFSLPFPTTDLHYICLRVWRWWLSDEFHRMITRFVHMRTKAAGHWNVMQNFYPENRCSSEEMPVDNTKLLIQTFRNAAKCILLFLHEGHQGSRPDHIFTKAHPDSFSSFLRIQFQTDGKNRSCTTTSKMFWNVM